jgi:CspA family cold shock protein
MASGILKMWNAARGFGFIGDDKGGTDTFLHISAVHSAGINPDDLTRGARLTFDVEKSRDGRTKAINVGRTA